MSSIVVLDCTDVPNKVASKQGWKCNHGRVSAMKENAFNMYDYCM